MSREKQPAQNSDVTLLGIVLRGDGLKYMTAERRADLRGVLGEYGLRMVEVEHFLEPIEIPSGAVITSREDAAGGDTDFEVTRKALNGIYETNDYGDESLPRVRFTRGRESHEPNIELRSLYARMKATVDNPDAQLWPDYVGAEELDYLVRFTNYMTEEHWAVHMPDHEEQWPTLPLPSETH
jgi:hypothetical protein